LLAAYATPYAVITEGIERAMLGAANLYLETISGDSNSPFTVFSKMDLLCLLQYVLRESYSFDFFIDALEESALKIDEGDYTDHQKAYALFFMNVTFIELGNKDSFDFLLEKYSDVLPTELALAVRHEAEYLEGKTTLMKKQDKKIKKLFQSQIQSTAIQKLYESPIRKLFG